MAFNTSASPKGPEGPRAASPPGRRGRNFALAARQRAQQCVLKSPRLYSLARIKSKRPVSNTLGPTRAKGLSPPGRAPPARPGTLRKFPLSLNKGHSRCPAPFAVSMRGLRDEKDIPPRCSDLFTWKVAARLRRSVAQPTVIPRFAAENLHIRNPPRCGELVDTQPAKSLRRGGEARATVHACHRTAPAPQACNPRCTARSAWRLPARLARAPRSEPTGP